MRVVIDTNLLFDSVAPKGDKHWVLDYFFEGKFSWIFSNEILSEYAEVLAENFGEKTMTFTISALISSFNHERFEPSYKYQMVTDDKDDNKFVDCAVGINVDYLVSDDKHIKNLLKIKNLFPPVPIITSKQFKAILDLMQ